ncbi:TetR/AcrR family transcriptional regulator [Celerinatantimonas sp. YJH-8]|uniref:TetR/AcrR family transcriptional regulator n=1 Tax=Celerinatantimonas sp. YJH-8 TaxID=3228714 RepID=UPI0038C132F7
MRTAEFDRHEVLEAAMEVFCRKGYANTTMQDLKIATGLHPGSLYCAFTNKRGILLAALQQFIENRWQQSQQCFQHENALEGIRSYLKRLVTNLLEKNSYCLLSRTIAEFSHIDDEISQMLMVPWQQLSDRLAQELKRAAAQGHLKSDLSIQDTTQMLFVMVMGLRSFPCILVDEQVLNASVDSLIELIRAPRG